MAQIAITLAPELSVELTLIGASSAVTVGKPPSVVGTALFEVLRGPQGLPGATVSTYTAAVALSGHIAVVLNELGEAMPADAASATHYAVAGLTTGAAMQDATVEAITKGMLDHSGWTFTAGLPVFLGLDGAITQALPVSALFSKVLGIALTPTRISDDFQPAIFV